MTSTINPHPVARFTLGSLRVANYRNDTGVCIAILNAVIVARSESVVSLYATCISSVSHYHPNCNPPTEEIKHSPCGYHTDRHFRCDISQISHDLRFINTSSKSSLELCKETI
ncbi:uncharacterized protein LOC116841495 [Odontomachus brunneus]|uniref:uncharacterized protein LOC116841495 n=1 Tax=Odontomachus brunneus TaxID=486640 RepID=UPI0013F1C51B|nr:uncharacterized protein LOC116841495 [Odontomachus brunneus]